MNPVLPLRIALVTNAIFSLFSALLMLFRPVLVGEWLGIQAPLILRIVGIGLIVFAAELIYQATRQRVVTWRALLASAADFFWVAGSIILLLALPQLFSPSGNVLVLAVAGIIFSFGVWQLWAAGHAHKTGADDEYRHCIIIETNAPPETMWQIVSDIGDIKNYMPSLERSVILDGKTPGVGAVRACEDRTGKQWAEECTSFVPGRSFDLRFLSEAPDFPFPAKTMRGGWEVIPSAQGSQVMVWWELTPKSKLLAPIILPILAFQADRDFPKIIKRMTEAALRIEGDAPMPADGGVLARLLPSFC